jgi:hypothetical protein
VAGAEALKPIDWLFWFFSIVLLRIEIGYIVVNMYNIWKL